MTCLELFTAQGYNVKTLPFRTLKSRYSTIATGVQKGVSLTTEDGVLENHPYPSFRDGTYQCVRTIFICNWVNRCRAKLREGPSGKTA